jgi:drug/metabolite transporter (DMT)-like permease
MIKEYLKLHFLVFIFGFTAILGKLIESSAVTVVFYRSLIASLVLLLIVLLRKRKLNIGFKGVSTLLFVGAVMGVHWLCFFGSARLSNVSVCLVTFSTTSFFTSILGPFITRKKIILSEIVLGSLSIVGMAIIFSFEYQYTQGIVLGLIGAALAAVFSTLNGQLTFKYQAQIISFYELLGSGITVGLLFPIFEYFGWVAYSALWLSSFDLLWVLILALVCTVFPYVQMLNILKKLSVFTANMSLNLEPIYGIVLAYMIFGEKERMSAAFYVGGGIVMVSVFVQGYLSRKTQP